MLEQVKTNPAMPLYWEKNAAGMQAQESLSEDKIAQAKVVWLHARDDAVKAVERLSQLELQNKQQIDFLNLGCGQEQSFQRQIGTTFLRYVLTKMLNPNCKIWHAKCLRHTIQVNPNS